MINRRVMASTHCPRCAVTFHLALKIGTPLSVFTVAEIEVELTTCPWCDHEVRVVDLADEVRQYLASHRAPEVPE